MREGSEKKTWFRNLRYGWSIEVYKKFIDFIGFNFCEELFGDEPTVCIHVPKTLYNDRIVNHRMIRLKSHNF